MITNEMYFFENQSTIDMSSSLYNVNDGTLILQVDGEVSELELSVLGNSDLTNDDFVSLKVINASNYTVSSNITASGIYWIDINGIRKIKLNLTNITGTLTVKGMTKSGLTTDLVARAMAANSQSGGCSLEEVKAITGDLENLSTKDKSNLVNAINEVASSSGEKVGFYNMSVDVVNPTMQSAYSTTEIKEQFRQIIQDVYNSGQGNAIINMYNSSSGGSTKIFSIQSKVSNKPTSIYFMEVLNTGVNRLGTYTLLQNSQIQCNCSWDENNNVTVKSTYNYTSSLYYLSTTNTQSFTPTGNYHPATKKYVDDAIASSITTALEANY